MSVATVKAQIPAKLKQEAEQVLADPGMDLTTGVRVFLVQIALRRCLPFPVDLSSLDPRATRPES